MTEVPDLLRVIGDIGVAIVVGRYAYLSFMGRILSRKQREALNELCATVDAWAKPSA